MNNINHFRIYTMKSIFTSVLLMAVTLLYGCASSRTGNSAGDENKITVSDDKALQYGTFPVMITIPAPSADQSAEFNANVGGKFTSITKGNGIRLSGYLSNNKYFVDKIMLPVLQPYMDQLKKQPAGEMINNLILFSHQMFRNYFGYDFYRWGGDLLDLDDPQYKITRHQYAYGLDCSGFSTFAYELAVYTGLMKADDPAALFSSKGFELYCKQNNVQDKGGREGTSNNYRLDTSDLISLGKEVFSLKKGEKPADSQISMLRAGDLINTDGHVGTIVIINSLPYYLESGGYVVPNEGGFPYPAKEALAICAQSSPVSVRRALPGN